MDGTLFRYLKLQKLKRQTAQLQKHHTKKRSNQEKKPLRRQKIEDRR